MQHRTPSENHNPTKFEYSTCTISHFGSYCEFSLDNQKWKITNDDPLEEHIWKEQWLASLVRSHLNHPGTIVRELHINNHPHGLECCVPLRVKKLHWECDIQSDRYDHSTWFDCIRQNDLESAHIEIVSDNLQVFLEPVLMRAASLTINSRVPLPLTGIQNFEGQKLVLLNQIATSEFLEAFFETWKHLKMEKTIEMKVNGSFQRQQLVWFVRERLCFETLESLEQEDILIYRLSDATIRFFCSDTHLSIKLIIV